MTFWTRPSTTKKNTKAKTTTIALAHKQKVNRFIQVNFRKVTRQVGRVNSVAIIVKTYQKVALIHKQELNHKNKNIL